jgi:chromosome segregation protein
VEVLVCLKERKSGGKEPGEIKTADHFAGRSGEPVERKHQEKYQEVASYNEQLKENEIRKAQEDINRLTNLVYSLHNKIENIHGLQTSSQSRLEEMQLNLEETIASIEGTRNDWTRLVAHLNELRDKLAGAETEFKQFESSYNTGIGCI